MAYVIGVLCFSDRGNKIADSIVPQELARELGLPRTLKWSEEPTYGNKIALAVHRMTYVFPAFEVPEFGPIIREYNSDKEIIEEILKKRGPYYEEEEEIDLDFPFV